MSWYPDLSNQTMVAVGDHVRAIGWLTSDQPFPQGKVADEFVAQLRKFVELASESAEALCFPAFGGWHMCELCEKNDDSRNFGVPAGPVLYIAPGMVMHYVEEHGYRPPAEFIAAVLASPLPDTVAYRSTVKRFRQVHEQWWQERFKRWQTIDQEEGEGSSNVPM